MSTLTPSPAPIDSPHAPRHEPVRLLHPGFVVGGALLAVAVAAAHALLSSAQIVEALGVLAGMLGGAYAGMGVVNPEPRKRWIQIGMGTVITALALAGLWLSPLFFALACFSHAAWDVVSGHPRCLHLPLVDWYVPMCLGFDVLFGVLILAWWMA